MADEALDQLQVYGTGNIFFPESPLNYNLKHMPGVKAQLPSLAPEDTHLTQYLGYTYNQGASPSCVWHTISGVMTGNEKIERHGQEIIYNAMEMHRRTGDPNQGRYTGDMLAYSQKNGVLRAAGNASDFIDTYAFAPKGSFEEFVNTYKAAIAAGYICGIALRLPSVFGRECQGPILGWDTYHEVIGCGYRPTPGQFGSALIKNSWSASWGDNGFGWCPFDLLLGNNYQEGACFINTIIDARDSDITPPNPPNPPNPVAKKIIITGRLTGGGSELVAVNQTLATVVQGRACALTVSDVSITDDVTPPNPPNPPTPTGIVVSGYSKNPVKMGDSLEILGSGFMGGNLFVTWKGQAVTVTKRTEKALTVQAPSAEGAAPMVVRIEAEEAQGPVLTVTGDTLPPSGMVVKATRVRTTGLSVTVSDSTGPVVATVTAVLNGSNLNPAGVNGNRTGPQGGAVTFTFPRNSTGDITVIAKADDGREARTVTTLG